MTNDFLEGWYFTDNHTAHYHEKPDAPICGRRSRIAKKPLTAILERRSAHKRDEMTKYLGGCASCVKRLKTANVTV